MQDKGLNRQPRRAICHSRNHAAVCAALLFALAMPVPAANAQAVGIEQRFAGSLTAMPAETINVSGSFYVPVYSSVSLSDGKLRADFAVTLTIHNASEARPLILKRVAYFDTAGKLVENYLKNPVALKPFATIEVFIPTADVRGGTGANFVVDWAATGEIAEPAVEALMIGGVGSGHYAFISQGRPVKVLGK